MYTPKNIRVVDATYRPEKSPWGAIKQLCPVVVGKQPQIELQGSRFQIIPNELYRVNVWSQREVSDDRFFTVHEVKRWRGVAAIRVLNIGFGQVHKAWGSTVIGDPKNEYWNGLGDKIRAGADVFYREPRPFAIDEGFRVQQGSIGVLLGRLNLFAYFAKSKPRDTYVTQCEKSDSESAVSGDRIRRGVSHIVVSAVLMFAGALWSYKIKSKWGFIPLVIGGCAYIAIVAFELWSILRP